ncbi:hypothetical protein G7046_g3827 [Stylonectria norvegica]|nr:hypothetical protein G7046_g3827 [Stylonectria norvegica]
MDPNLRSPDHRDRAASSEPSSTRPNPFDDSDLSSRKRQRTSLSGSPAASVDTVNPLRDSSSSATLDGDTTLSNTAPAAAVVAAATDPITLQTPERRCSSSEPDASSSMVTLNLRNVPQGDGGNSSPISPSPHTEAAAPTILAPEAKASVEDPEVEMVTAPTQDATTPQSSSSSSSSSPPIEVITVHSDDDMGFDGQSAGVSVIGEDLVLVDPVRDFPYIDSEQTIVETLHRLTQYLSDQDTIELHVLESIQQWIELYLRYTKDADQETARDSCRLNRGFWLTFPGIISAMASRKRPLLGSPELRAVTMALYTAFAKTVAWFVTVDRRTIQEFKPAPAQQASRGPDLIALGYLQQLHNLVRPRLYGDAPHEPEILSPQPGDAAYLMKAFQASPGGSLDYLKELSTELVDLIPAVPKIFEALAPICQVASDIMTDSTRVISSGQHYGLPTAIKQLQAGHELHNLVAAALTTMIDRHVTQLSGENVMNAIVALTEMLKLGLKGHHQLATDVLLEHRQAWPALSLKYTLEAIVWERRFSTLIKLIRSSQMQLRVMAVTTMCNDLVGWWKRSSDAGEECQTYLDHLAQYLLRSELVEYILGPNCHPEIIVESANIIGFLVVTKNYRQEHTELLWQGIMSSQDPRVADALTRMVAVITNLFDYLGLLGLSEKLQTLPIEGFTPAVRQLWENVTQMMVTRSAANQSTLSFHPYDLCLRLLRDSSVCASGSQVAHPDMQFAATQKFKDLLAYGPDAEGRQQLYLSCIHDVEEKSPTTLGSLCCLSMAIRSKLNTEIKMLTEEFDLARLIVDELEHAAEAGRAAGVPAVLNGNSNQPRRDFLYQIILLEPTKVNNDLGLRLWNILVGPQSPCPEDRKAGWNILNAVLKRSSFRNPFLMTCLSRFLPALPSSCFCEGMLDFVREEVIPRVNDINDIILDDDETISRSGIEQLWRLILEADDVSLVEQSVRALAIDVYIESRQVIATSLHRARLIHLALVDRCLRQLREAARKIRISGDSSMSGDSETMAVSTTEDEVQRQERIFIRSLKLLRDFLEAHQSSPRFAAPDLRTLITQAPYEVEGESAELKYQCFDGDEQTEVKPLSIGKLNTAASLLASLRQETGFENYRVYYRGQPFLPSEQDICKSLQDLRVHDGIILVKRETNNSSPSTRIKPGASPLEVEISAHFDEMWDYLSMDERLAQEIYHFLVRLPTDGHVINTINSNGKSYTDVFSSGQPFKSLYAVHALVQYTEAAFHGRATSGAETGQSTAEQVSYDEALRRSMSLIVQAISDEALLDGASMGLRLKLSSSLIYGFIRFLNAIDNLRTSSSMKSVQTPEPSRLVDILANAVSCPDEAASQLITGTLAVILRLSLLDVQFWDQLGANLNFSSLLQNLLLFDPRQSIRAVAAKQLEDATVAEEQVRSSSKDGMGNVNRLSKFAWSIAFGLIPKTLDVPSHCEEFFRLTHFLLLSITARSPGIVDIPALTARASELLLDHTSTEDIGQMGPVDLVARGLTSLLLLCVQLEDSVATSMVLPPNLAKALFWKLYPGKRGENLTPVPKVFLNGETRAKLCDFIFHLVKHDKQKVRSVLEDLNSLVPFYEEDEDDHYLYELPYNFDKSTALRASCGYTGLLNLSNTCYLNSLLTQLFMNTGFRQFVMDSRIDDPSNTQQLLFWTRKLFGFMQESYRRYVDPTNLVNSIKTYDDTPVDIHNQMDVDEFYNLLFDRWEGQIVTAAEKRKMRSFFGGQLVQQVKSKECNHISERLEPFSAIQCDIKGKSTLQESLQAYVDGEIMEGDNKYKCSTCDRHVDAVKRACLKDIPDNVIFHLKRFDFNLRTLQRSKINDYFSFPAQVDLQPYTIEHLSESGSDSKEDVFELVGVLVHSGTAESGHYYSYIRERPTSADRPSWVEFNDDAVAPWDPALLESSTFGGPDHRPIYETNGILYDKPYSAYMLFYQRASSLKREQEAMVKQHIPAPLRVEIAGDLKEHILDENTVLLRRQCLFDPSHNNLVRSLFIQAEVLTSADVDSSQMLVEADQVPVEDVTKEPDDHELKDLAMTTAISHLDQVVSRTKEVPDFPAFAKMINDAIYQCRKCAFAFFDYFSTRHAACRALLQRDPDPAVRLFTSRTLIWALEKISKELPQLYDATTSSRRGSETDADGSIASRGSSLERSRCVLDGVMDLFDYQWRFFQGHLRAWDEHFGTLLGFAKLGHRETSLLLAHDYLNKLIRIISADQSMDLPANYARMLHNVLRRPNTRPPSYAAIIATIGYLIEQLAAELDTDTIVENPAERLESASAPFAWSSAEVQLIHTGMDSQVYSHFVEKLVGIDQVPGLTDGIIRRLTTTSTQMDQRILGTLRRCIRGDTSTQPMDPYLRAAAAYIESTTQLDSAARLVQHVCAQAKGLQNTEGAVFLDFFATTLNLPRRPGGHRERLRALSLKLLPKWAPRLLVYPDNNIRFNTEVFLKRELFQYLEPGAPGSLIPDTRSENEDSDDDDGTENGAGEPALIREKVKELGIMCLSYLQENYVARRVQLVQDAATVILRVVEQCANSVDDDPETQDEADIEFLALQTQTLDSFRRLIIDDIEEDGSGMLQSFSDSDTITADLA